MHQYIRNLILIDISNQSIGSIFYFCRMIFSQGDLVKLLDEEGEGVIEDFLPNEMVRVNIDGFSFEYSLYSILKITDSNEAVHEIANKTLPSVEEKTIRNPKLVLQHIPNQVFEKVNQMGIPEIDLHIYELVDKPKNLNNSEMIQIQSFRLEQFIQECIAKSVNEFVAIHGVGGGVLKGEVRKILDSHGNMKYQDADFREYGSGATHVRILGLFQ
jgi:hypothetical protein